MNTVAVWEEMGGPSLVEYKTVCLSPNGKPKYILIIQTPLYK